MRLEGRARHIRKDTTKPPPRGPGVRQSGFIDIIVDGHSRTHDVMIRRCSDVSKLVRSLIGTRFYSNIGGLTGPERMSWITVLYFGCQSVQGSRRFRPSIPDEG